MKKNGFTLIELIAAIGLLAMLSTITISVVVRKINETKEKSRDTMIDSIELAAKQYISDYGNDILEFNNYDNVYITLQTLVENEYFTESLIDPTTKKSLPLTDEIYITREESGEITSTYNVNQRNLPKLTLIGAYNEYIEEGSEYIEKGVIAISPSKEDLSNNVIITGIVDTLTPNTYKITYELENIKITRNIIVYNKNISSEEILKASTYIERLYKTNNYQNAELSNPKATYEGKEYDTGIRYTGANPNNYVYYNCDDIDIVGVSYGEPNYNYASSCEVWRIIGVFEVKNSNNKKEKRVKIINTASTFTASWDSSADGTIDGQIAVNKGYGINQWGESTYIYGDPYEGSDLMRFLNGFYLSSNQNKCVYCNNLNQQECINICTEESLKQANMKVLTNTSKEMIEKAVWDTYATNTSTASTAYLQEKGISNQYTGKNCTATNEDGSDNEYCSDKVNRTTRWTGIVGLMSVSDIAYANGWLYANNPTWSITPLASNEYARITYLSYDKSITTSAVYYKYSIFPSIYLKQSIKIKGGNGTSSSPYILSR